MVESLEPELNTTAACEQKSIIVYVGVERMLSRQVAVCGCVVGAMLI